MRWGLGLVVMIVLAGCTAAPTPVGLDTSSGPAPSPTPHAVSLGPAGTVIAIGHFDPAEGVTGTIELVIGESGLTDVRLTGFTSTLDPGAALALSPFPLVPDRACLDGFAVALTSPPAGDSVTTVGDLGDLGGGDPSFLDGAVIAMYVESDHAQFDCGRSILARAAFVWTIPDLRPGLVVVDSGAVSGANGTVTQLKDGNPATYIVAPGDVLAVIAERFGVTVDDLNYLNPFRTGMAITDEIINLDRGNRNAPWG